jgi:hypothetical protein
LVPTIHANKNANRKSQIEKKTRQNSQNEGELELIRAMNEDWTGDLYLKKEFYALVRKIQYKNGHLTKEDDKSQTKIVEDFVQKWGDSLKQEAFSNPSPQKDSFPTKNSVMTNVDSNFLFRSIPVQHHYQKQNLSFLVLKGDDAYLASELSKCRNIQVFLAL